MRIPPLDEPIDIPAGSYTLFVDLSKGEPWTLIISKKTGKAGRSEILQAEMQGSLGA